MTAAENKDRIAKKIDMYPHKNNSEICETFGRLNNRPTAAEVAKVRASMVPGAAASKKGKSLSEFRQSYDKSFIVPKRLKEGIKALGATGWEYEVQFAKTCGISLSDLGNFRDEFAAHVIQIPGGRRVWAGSVKLAEQMKAMI